ncbi:MAG: kelch repeat-containing protein [Elusimicrobiota bacterium]|jgi:N-acetylneuraminic acid mutarotase
MKTPLRALLIATCAWTITLVLSSPVRAAPDPRVHHTTTLLPDGHILITGGINAVGGAVLGDATLYLSEKGGPTAAAAPLAVARASHTATLLSDGRVLIVGGAADNSGNPVPMANFAEVYTPASDSWVTIPSVGPAARYGHTATLLPDGRVLIVGGQTGPAALTNTCAIFDPQTNTFGAASPMLQARTVHSAVILFSGKVFVAGGISDALSDFSVSTELYDPVNDLWTPGPTMITKRAFHTATTLGNRKVLIAGGFNGKNIKENQGILDTTEIYDPVSDSISPGAVMIARKMLHGAALNANGQSLILGGLGNITTSYFHENMHFTAADVPGGQVDRLDISSVTAVSGKILRTSYLPLSAAHPLLSSVVNGRILDGDILFSSPTARLPNGDGKLFFENPGTKASLAGVYIGNGILNTTEREFPLSLASGTVVFFPREENLSQTQLVGGSLPFVLTPLVANSSGSVVGGTLSGTFELPFPTAYEGARVLVGQAVITGGSISSDDAVDPTKFTINLSSGIADISGATIITLPRPEATTAILKIPLSFTGVTGLITNTESNGGPSLSSPVVAASRKTSISVRMSYVVDRMNIKDQLFDFDVATVAIRRMMFQDESKYSPSANTWVNTEKMGFPFTNSPAGVVPNGDTFLFGGFNCDDSTTTFTVLDSRDPFGFIPHPDENPSWKSLSSMSKARSHFTSSVLPDGKTVVAGGTDGVFALNDTEIFDPKTHDWSTARPMRVARNLHSTTLLPDGTLLTAGGSVVNSSTGATKAAEIFYPDSNSWALTSPMISSRNYHTAVLLPDGNVLVAGGYDAGGNFLSSAEIYISTAHLWRSIAPMGTARAQHTMTLLHTNKVLVAGGVNNSVLDDVEIYDPGAGAWAPAAAMNLGRYAHSATLLRDGRVLAAGGSDGFGETNDAEIYDPETNAWTDTANTGNSMCTGRLRHSAMLLPDGKVMIVGGVKASGEAVKATEQFDVDISSWEGQGDLNKARFYHSSVLLHDGNLMTVGGFDGASRLAQTEYRYYASEVDAATPSPGERRPLIVSVDTPTFNRGSFITLHGKNFKGVTEASGGRGGANASYHNPRVYMQRVDSTANGSLGASGFLLDMSTYIYAPAAGNSWSNVDSSITFQVPSSIGMLPFGWYQIRVAASAVFSTAAIVQVGPPRPTGTPGIPSGVFLGISSVAWTWAAAPGSFDGYRIYSATDGVFLGTSSIPSFLQQNLGPNTVASIRVAAYTITGDGPVAISTVPIATPVGNIMDLQAIPQPTALLLTWAANSTAVSYKIYSSTKSEPIGTSPTNSFLLSGLSTNTVHVSYVQAVTEGGDGPLSLPCTAYTAAAPPLDNGNGTLVQIGTMSMHVNWNTNGNPDSTQYVLGTNMLGDPTWTSIFGLTQTTHVLTGLLPNKRYTVRVAAINGDGIFTPYTTLGTTCTLANTPLNLGIVSADASSIRVSWDSNLNSTDTIYQVSISSDGFSASISTPIPFALGITTTSATLSGLETGQSYDIRVAAQNRFGQETAFASTQGVTVNGGGPVGSLSTVVPKGELTILTGTLGSGRTITLRIPPGTFEQDVRVEISSTSANPCGNIDAAITVAPSPNVQPRGPFELGITYTPGESGLGSLSTLGMVRFDAQTNACVPLESRVDAASHMVSAKVNHLSTFQLQQIPASASIHTVRVFPNPLHASNQSYITFDHLPAATRVHIYTLHGEKLFDETANSSGLLIWNARNLSGRPVASGLYLAVLEARGERKIVKIAVVR